MIAPRPWLETVRAIDVAGVRHILFDFDGTISLLREGWQRIMAPVMVEMICGDTSPTASIRTEVEELIDRTTGIQTILQMEELVDLVKRYGRALDSQIMDAQAYKQVYLERLMQPVEARIVQIQSRQMEPDDFILCGARDFLETLHDRGFTLYLASGTDEIDVKREAAILGVDHLFQGGIWGARKTFAEYSKDKVIGELIGSNNLAGPELLVFGDGPVEIRNAKAHGAIGIGVASDEVAGRGWNEGKRERLRAAGANLLIPDFSHNEILLDMLPK